MEGPTECHFGRVEAPPSKPSRRAPLADLQDPLAAAGLGLTRAPRCQPGMYRGPSGRQGDRFVRDDQHPQPLTRATAMVASQSVAPASSQWKTGLAPAPSAGADPLLQMPAGRTGLRGANTEGAAGVCQSGKSLRGAAQKRHRDPRSEPPVWLGAARVAPAESSGRLKSLRSRFGRQEFCECPPLQIASGGLGLRMCGTALPRTCTATVSGVDQCDLRDQRHRDPFMLERCWRRRNGRCCLGPSLRSAAGGVSHRCGW